MATRCLNCGNVYKAAHHLMYVKTCNKCIRRFGNDDIEGYLKKFYKRD